MKFYTVSELRAHAPRIISEVESTKKEVIITKNGKPTVLIRLIDDDELILKPEKGGKKHGKRSL